MNFHGLYVLELKTNKQKFSSVWLYVCTYVRGFLAVDTITFEGVRGSKKNLVDSFMYKMWF